MENRSPELLKPTLISGVLFGTLGALPFLGLVNCACCALIVSCGFLASYLYSGECRRQGVEFRPGTGAVVGLVAGAFYAMSDALVSAVVHLAIGDVVSRMILESIRALPNLPPENVEMIDGFLEKSGALTVVGLLLNFFFTLLLGAVFSTVGGLIGGAAFRVPPPPPPSPDPPPPPAPPPAIDPLPPPPMS